MAQPKRAHRRGTVTPIRPLTPLQAGQAALTRGEWRAAKRHFESSLSRAGEDDPEAHEGLGLAAWWLDQADLVFESRQRAYRLYRQRKNAVAAARVAVWLAWDSAAFRGESAVANGWLQRAHTLLDGEPECAEQAWLAAREGFLALVEDGDPDRALDLANRAVRIGRDVAAIDYEIIGGALRGLALVTSGQVLEGQRQLDAVHASVLAGEVTDPIAIGLSGCYLLAACERARDSKRAGQWCVGVKRFCKTWGLKPLLAVCRTQYGSMCVWRGDWAEAEKELVTATHELLSSRPALSGEGQARLGELRRRQGRFDEAAELFDQSGHHPVALVGRVALHLDRGEPRKAMDLADRYLRQLPAHNRTERAAGLEPLVRACAALGSLDRAAEASRDLDAISREAAVPHLLAAASQARGHVAAAAGDDASAQRSFEDAVDLFQRSGAPFETARARLDLARALGRLGQASAARDEVRRAVRSLDGVHAAFELAQARELDAALKTAVVAPAPVSSARTGLTLREQEIVRLIAGGLNNDRIGQRLFISGHTVHRHVANIFAKLNVRTRSAIVARAAKQGIL